MRKLLKALATTGSAGATAMVLGLATNKILALTLGPAGVGLYSLYRQVVEIAAGIGNIGGGGAAVQAISSTEGEARRRRIATALWLSTISSAALAVIGFFAADAIAARVFVTDDDEVVAAIRIMGVAVAATIFASMLTATLNAARALGWMAIVQIVSSVSVLACAWPLARAAASGWQYAFIGLMLVAPLATMIGSLYAAARIGWLPALLDGWRTRADRDSMRHYGRFYVATLITGIVSSAVFLLIRPMIVKYGVTPADGLTDLGYFQAAWTLTMQNLSLLLTAFATYVFPTLAAAPDAPARHKILDDAALLVAMCSIPAVGVGLLFQPLILDLLYSNKFREAGDTLRWMLLGNYLRAAQWVFFIPIMSFARTNAMIVVEVSWHLAFLGAAWLALSPASPLPELAVEYLRGVEGVGFGFMVLYGCNLVGCYLYTRRQFGFTPALRTVLSWLAGGAVLVACCALTWDDRAVNWGVALPMLAAVCATPLLLVDARRRGQVIELVRSRLRR